MTSITVNLISGRTIQQGVSMEAGKEKEDYMKSCGIIELDAADIAALGIWKNSNVRVTSDFGSVIVKAIEATQGPHPGLAWIPMGPWANMVVDTNTYSTGMPTFKGTKVTVEPAEDEKVLNSIELVLAACGEE
ncbi:MAG TPA: molybdopterin dinucleotide-binding protein [Methanocorpusculum sp.]|nr:molybdopterin dinucleotide-binding protein [Methanocorpusculum sp.]MBR5007986.1 molybdopterin dinucleotide-binding protein [Methanocorpusculum sp.]MBR5142654.1 molybdopterin dinucleotide-binding protein [Methanocorpusculum sp.]MBR5450783.1 molybdopterin dinucleotide-binding protein [Methanocorpusculum sp.]HJJ65965.1 molybdopterin dinucleotide-binding protein [Methanocorpusculum sp.]